ncbi:MAG: riboflavin biosynthesis protein RibF [Bacillota bacterium]
MARILCLGFFDSVHCGHRALIEVGAKLAKDRGVQIEVVTFDDGFFTARNRGEKLIYTARERKKLLLDLGVDRVQIVQATGTLFNMEGDDFLNSILSKDVVGVVVGSDYKYGKNAQGNVNSLLCYCNKRNIDVKIVDLVEVDLHKIASSDIRELLKNGDISSANMLLGQCYSMYGKVVHGKGNGKKFDIPTANIAYSWCKLLPKRGVYKTNTIIEGVSYASLTNVGTQPTFEGSQVTVETLILHYKGNDIYNKNITVEFDRRLRGISKFNSPDELVAQIKKDIAEVEADD